MNKSPAYQRYPDKWLADTRRLSWSAKGMYADLLDVIWLQFQDTCSIPNDDEFIASELGASLDDWKKAKGEILDPRRPLLMVSPDSQILFSNGLMKEAEKQKEWRRKSSLGGKKSAKKRWPKSLRVDNHPITTLTECLQPNGNIPSPIPSPSPIPKKKKSVAIAPIWSCPEPLNTPRFRTAFDSFIEHRRQKRSGMTALAIVGALGKLETMGHDRAIVAIEHSIAQGYTGIFEPNGGTGHGRTDADQRRAEKNSREYVEPERPPPIIKL